jgi:hypothetical protein
MKKNILLKIFLTSFCFLFILGLSAGAANLNNAFKVDDKSNKDVVDTTASVAGYDTAITLNKMVATIIQSALGLLGVIFLLYIIYGGVIWMTAEGEEAKVEKAQKILRNATIGLIITVSSYAISYFVINALSQRALAQ